MAEQEWPVKRISKESWACQVGDVKIEVSGQLRLDVHTTQGNNYTLIRSKELGFVLLCIPFGHSTNWEKITPIILSTDEQKLEKLSAFFAGWMLVRENNRKVQVYRDPLGRLPCFYRRHLSGLCFSSAAHFLSKRRALNHHQVFGYLHRCSTISADDFLVNIFRIHPGQVIEVTKGGAKSGKNSNRYWWKVNISGNAELESQKIMDLLVEEIEIGWSHASESPSLALSAGVDSTLLLEILLEVFGGAKTFSMISPPDKRFDKQKRIRENLQGKNVQAFFFDISGPLNWKHPEIHNPLEGLGYGPNLMPEQPYFSSFFSRVKEETDHILFGVGADQLFHGLVLEKSNWKKIVKKKVPQLVGLLPRRDLSARSPFVTSEFHFFKGDAQRQSLSAFQTQRLGWSWEMMMRNLERNRRNTGVLIHVPFLTPKIFRYFASINPESGWLTKKSYEEFQHKTQLRDLLRGRSTDEITTHRKTTSFDEVVRRGLFEFGKQSLIKVLKTSQQPFGIDLEYMIEWLGNMNSGVVTAAEISSFWRASSLTLWWNQLPTPASLSAQLEPLRR